MGCCSGKGGELNIDSLDNLKIDSTGIACVDEFGEKLKALLETLKEIGKPYMEKKRQIMQLTKFSGKRQVTMRHVLVGIVVQGAGNASDVRSMGLKFTSDSPYISAPNLDSVPNCSDSAKAL